MKNIVLALSLVSSTVVLAGNPKGTGNFNREAVLKAARAKQSDRVVGLTTQGNHVLNTEAFKTKRVSMVQHENGKVSVVSSDINTRDAKLLTDQAIKAHGLITQEDAQAQLEATKGVKLRPAGLDNTGGSYRFIEAGTNREHTLTVTGTGESAGPKTE
jgi:hypothetical protein